MAQMFGGQSEYLKMKERRNYILSWFLILISIILVYFGFRKNLSLLFKPEAPLIVVVSMFLIYILAILFIRESDIFLKISNKFSRGRHGEGAIWYELKKLPHIYSVFQDVKFGENEGNIDFVVLGPTGIFAVEVKSHAGFIDFNGEELTLNGKIFPEKDILKQVEHEVMKLHEYLQKSVTEKLFVKSTLVFSNKKTRMKFGLKPIRWTFVVQKGFLRKLIQSQPLISNTIDLNSIRDLIKPLC